MGYALAGEFQRSLHCWKTQAPLHISPNGGVVMAAGAGALGCRIGGPQVYGGVLVEKPWLGEGDDVEPADIGRASSLIETSLWSWLALFALLGVLRFFLSA